jgi:hypothetical protein
MCFDKSPLAELLIFVTFGFQIQPSLQLVAGEREFYRAVCDISNPHRL